MIYYMDGKTFMKKYINEDPDRILKTQYVIVSSTIRKTGKFEKQVLNANKLLFPDYRLIMDYSDYDLDSEYASEYIDYIDNIEVNSFIAKLVLFSLKNKNTDIIFMCGKEEMKYNYFKLLQLHIAKKIGYKILKWSNKDVDDDEIYIQTKEQIKNNCKNIIKIAKKQALKKALNNKHTRNNYLKSRTKKELFKICKKENIHYSKDMSKSELRDIINEFY